MSAKRVITFIFVFMRRENTNLKCVYRNVADLQCKHEGKYTLNRNIQSSVYSLFNAGFLIDYKSVVTDTIIKTVPI